MGSKLKTASWILLTLIGALTLFGSLASVGVAYFGSTDDDQIGPVTLTELTSDRPDITTALRARRGTAAAYAAGFAVLFLFVVLVPYRRGDVWSWWALLAGILVNTGIILLRRPILQTDLGLGAATIPLAVGVIALMLGAGRLRRAS